MVFAHARVGELVGFSQGWFWQVLGTGLLLFAAELFYQATRRRMATWRALLASVADFSWVVATGFLLLAFPSVFTFTGVVLALLVAGAVMVFALLQLAGIERAHRYGARLPYRHCLMVSAPAPAGVVWEQLARLGEIERHYPVLSSSRLRDPEHSELGAVRECTDRAGRRWAEECTAWEEGRSFELRFLSHEPGFPFPVREMIGGWIVEPRGKEACEVTVWWELQPLRRWQAFLLLPLLGFQADGNMRKVVASMAGRAHRAGVALLPRFC